MKRENIDIRVMILQAGLTQAAVAKKIGISREWLSALMRYRLSDENRARVIGAIEDLRGGE